MPMAAYLGKYRKMHIPDDPLYLESSTLHLAIWALKLSHPTCQSRHPRLLGSVVPRSRTAHRLARCRNPGLSHRHWMAPAEKAEYGEAQQVLGKPFSVVMPLPTAAMLQASIVLAMKGPRAAALSFGVAPLSMIRSGGCFIGPVTTRKRSSSSSVTQEGETTPVNTLALPARSPHRCLWQHHPTCQRRRQAHEHSLARRVGTASRRLGRLAPQFGRLARPF